MPPTPPPLPQYQGRPQTTAVSPPLGSPRDPSAGPRWESPWVSVQNSSQAPRGSPEGRESVTLGSLLKGLQVCGERNPEKQSMWKGAPSRAGGRPPPRKGPFPQRHQPAWVGGDLPSKPGRLCGYIYPPKIHQRCLACARHHPPLLAVTSSSLTS